MKICKGCGKEYLPRHDKDHRCQECYQKLGKRSKRKGNSNELRFAKYLNEQFKKYDLPYVAKRTPRSGAFHSLTPSDIMFFGLPKNSIFNDFHWENKDVNQWDVYGWYEEAVRKEQDTGTNKNPLIIARRPNKNIEFAILNIKDLAKILMENELYRNDNK